MGVFTDIAPAAPPSAGSAPPGGVFSGITAKPTAPHGVFTGVAAPTKVAQQSFRDPSTPSFFQGTEPSGTFLGISDQTDPFSGKPYLAWRAPGATATTTDTTRVAAAFNPEVAQKIDPQTIQNGRLPPSASAPVKAALGGNYSDELDHTIALELAGSNDRSNLKLEPGIKGGESATFDTEENQLARQVAAGTMSLFQAQYKLASDKAKAGDGNPVPFVDTAQPRSIFNPPDNSLLGILKNSVTGLPGAALSAAHEAMTLAQSAVGAPSEQNPEGLANVQQLSKKVNDVITALAPQTDALKKQKAELDAAVVDPHDPQAVAAYNQKIKIFNADLQKYTSQAAQAQKIAGDYNDAVTAYNGTVHGPTGAYGRWSDFVNKTILQPYLGAVATTGEASANVTAELSKPAGKQDVAAMTANELKLITSALGAASVPGFAPYTVANAVPVVGHALDPINWLFQGAGAAGSTGAKILEPLVNTLPINEEDKQNLNEALQGMGSTLAQFAVGAYLFGRAGKALEMDGNPLRNLKDLSVADMKTVVDATLQFAKEVKSRLPQNAQELQRGFVKNPFGGGEPDDTPGENNKKFSEEDGGYIGVPGAPRPVPEDLGPKNSEAQNEYNQQQDRAAKNPAQPLIDNEVNNLKGAYTKGAKYTETSPATGGKTVTATGADAYRQHLEELHAQIDLSEAGYRYATDESNGLDVRGVKSSFPQYVPEELRSRDLFDKVKEKLDNYEYPRAQNTRQRALFDSFYDEMDRRTGVDTSRIRARIKSLYDAHKPAAGGRAPEPAGGGPRGGEAGAGRRGRAPDAGGAGQVDSVQKTFNEFAGRAKGERIDNPYEKIATTFRASDALKKITGATDDVSFTRLSLKHLAEKGAEGKRLLEFIPDILSSPDEIYKGAKDGRFLAVKSLDEIKKGRPQVVVVEVTKSGGDTIVTAFQSDRDYLGDFELLWRPASPPSQQPLREGGSSRISALRGAHNDQSGFEVPKSDAYLKGPRELRSSILEGRHSLIGQTGEGPNAVVSLSTSQDRAPESSKSEPSVAKGQNPVKEQSPLHTDAAGKKIERQLHNPAAYYTAMENAGRSISDISPEFTREDITRVLDGIKEREAKAAAKAAATEKSSMEWPYTLSFKEELKRALYPIKELPDDVKPLAEAWVRGDLTAAESANRLRAELPQSLDRTLPTDEAVRDFTAIQYGKYTPARAAFDNEYAYGTKRGLDIHYVENYLPQVYKETLPEIKVAMLQYMRDHNVDPLVADAYVEGVMELPYQEALRLKVNPSFVKEKVFPNYGVAAKYGLHPKFTNLADLVANYRFEMEKSLNNKRFAESLIAQGKLLSSAFAPAHWEHVTTNFITGDLYAAPELARLINGKYGEGTTLFGSIVGGFRAVNHQMQRLMLSGAVPFTNIHFWSIGNLIKEWTAGRFAGPTAAFVRSNNLQAHEAWFKKNQDYADMAARQGINISSRMGSIQRIFSEQSKGDTWRSYIGTKFDAAFTDKSFATFMPELYLQTFKDLYQRGLRQGMDPAAAERLAGDTTKAFYGMLGTEGRARVVSDTLSSFFFAPQFREGVLGTLVNTGKSMTTEFRNPAFYLNRRLFAGMVMTYGMYNVFNQILNGTPMWGNPDGHNFELRIPLPDGNNMFIAWMPSFLALPRSLATAAIAGAHADFPLMEQQVGNLFGPLEQMGIQVAANRDYFGRQIYNPNDPPKAKIAALAGYVGLQNNHPYVRALYDLIAKKVPLYQMLSEAVTLPLKFASDKTIAQNAYYNAKAAKAQTSAAAKGNIASVYDQVQQLVADGKTDEAQKIVDGLSDAQYAAYAKYRTAQKTKATDQEKASVYPTYTKVQTLLAEGRTEEAQHIIDGMTDAEYRAYGLLKKQYAP